MTDSNDIRKDSQGGPCPWCKLLVDAGFSKPPLARSRRCPCGAIALGSSQGRKEAIDAMVAWYGIVPSKIHGDIYAQNDWLKDFYIQTRPGDPAAGVDWSWFKRELPWEPPAGPMRDEERLAWLEAQGEKNYDLMYDSQRPDTEYRRAKEAFEDAIALAHKMGREGKADQLEARLTHIKEVFRSQFS